ncbi:MAG TPA: hypothetical protein VKC60_15585 [Opitutaceae bacterium]|nr:hypothetical protein [Opitutaceae bacterium]
MKKVLSVLLSLVLGFTLGSIAADETGIAMPLADGHISDKDPQLVLKAQAKKAAAQRAANYFRYEYQAGSGSVKVTAINFEWEEPVVASGWLRRYRTEGKVFLEFFDSKGRSFNRTTQAFEVTTETDENGSTKAVDFVLK